MHHVSSVREAACIMSAVSGRRQFAAVRRKRMTMPGA